MPAAAIAAAVALGEEARSQHEQPRFRVEIARFAGCQSYGMATQDHLEEGVIRAEPLRVRLRQWPGGERGGTHRRQASRQYARPMTGPVNTAFVRNPSPRLADAELTFLERAPVDVELARRQHAAYRELLSRLGLDVVAFPEAPEHPDGVFVEDVVVIVDDTAILTRPGAESRRGEVATARVALEQAGFSLRALVEPATLDGGDVLQVGDTIYVGRTRRTNDAAAEQLRAIVGPLGRQVVQVDVTGALHLKTAVTALPDGTFVALPDWLDASVLAGEVLAAPEPTGGDVLLVGDTVIISSSAPRTADLIRHRGFRVQPVDISEFEKCEAGVTCLSVLAAR